MRLYGSYGADGAELTKQERAMQDASMILDEALGNKYTGHVTKRQKVTKMKWSSITTVPEEDGEYVCYTNYGDVFVLKFHNGAFDRPDRFIDDVKSHGAAFLSGESVQFWCDKPTEGN
jgi:hypothetical protein